MTSSDRTSAPDDLQVWRAGNERLAPADRSSDLPGHDVYGPEDAEVVESSSESEDDLRSAAS